MNLKRLPVLEIRKIYVDNLAEWVEVPVFEQEDIIRLVNEIDWEGLDMRQYKKILTDHWPGLSVTAKAKLKSQVARDELYEVLIHENWGLRPGNALDQVRVYTKAETDNVQMWFASRGAKGRPPEVFSNA